MNQVIRLFMIMTNIVTGHSVVYIITIHVSCSGMLKKRNLCCQQTGFPKAERIWTWKIYRDSKAESEFLYNVYIHQKKGQGNIFNKHLNIPYGQLIFLTHKIYKLKPWKGPVLIQIMMGRPTILCDSEHLATSQRKDLGASALWMIILG